MTTCVSRCVTAAGARLARLLRTNLGRAAVLRREIISAHAGGPAAAGASWRDVPMPGSGDSWEIELPLAETGFFKAKAYLLDEKSWQHWPEGPDAGISVHPDFARTANTIYCAFTRLFGATKNLPVVRDDKLEAQLRSLESLGYAALPPSGKFRDLARQLPHIVQKLGCRIIHLLPVYPTPTTYARFGRFGSPYAALDMTAIDPALVEFDKRTTGVDQFCELTRDAHSLGARVFLDIIINHTGWGSVLQENHPEYFGRNPDGAFASPGAWGTTWEDLVELEQDNVVLWDKIADALLIWCRRGTDGFRCDAGYKIPVPAWQYIIARVQDEFPETIFLLEGPAVSGQVFRGFPRSAETFQQKNGFREFILDTGDDVLPGRHGNFIAGIAPETVCAAPAPDQEGVGNFVPQHHVVLFQFNEIFPGGSPGAGTGKRAVGIPPEIFGVIFLQNRTPAGVVDDDVEEHARAQRMRVAGKFAKLVHAGGALVKFNQRRVNGRHVKRGIRAAETAEARIGRRRGMNRQQMDDAATELLNDVRQLAGEVAQFAGRRKTVKFFPSSD